MVPALVDAIKAQGLALVVDKSSEVGGGGRGGGDASCLVEKFPGGVDGVFRYTGVLRFNDSIDM